MWNNFLKITARNFLRNKLYSFINVFGLAVGLTCVILIGLYVADELSFDRYHPDADRLYRVSRDFYGSNGAGAMYLATNAAPAAEQLKADFPGIEASARLTGGRVLLSWDDVAFYDDAVQFVDAPLLQMFAFDWIAGDATALNEPDSIVLTESTARRYFGTTDALGKRMQIENSLDFTVTGVIRDLPDNTHLRVNALGSLETMLRVFGEQARTDWFINRYQTYVKLAPGVDMSEIESGFPAFMNRHLQENASQVTGMSAMNVANIHLQSTRQFEMKAPGSMASVISLITIAIGILVIACFNFMNLATARSSLRGKEVGVRKTIGAERHHLIWQFLGESMLMTMVATIFAVAFVELVLPAFNGFTGKTLTFDLLSNSALQLGIVVMVIGVGSLSGSYPAFYLSSFKPAQVLKRRISAGLADMLFRNLLVVLQFSISIILVIATSVVLLQIRHAQQLDAGFDREQVVVLAGPPSQGITTRWNVLREELLRNPAVSAVTASNIVPGQENLNTFGLRERGSSERIRDTAFMMIDYGFFETYDVPLLSGRAFGEDFPNDRVAMPSPENLALNGGLMINAAAARDMGWTADEAIDKELEIFAGNVRINGRVVGVVADSNFESARFALKPLFFMLTPPGIWMNQFPMLASASVRVSSDNMGEALTAIDEIWNRVIPEFPVTRSFVSDNFEALYQDDTRLGEMFSYFAALAIVIACLGLFGLATFNAQRRTKEIGVRKVMGGSAWSIVLLLTNDFSKLVLIANVIAWPVAYLAMNSWLQNFAYRIDLTPLIFLGSSLIALCVAWVTVGGTAARAASAPPVLALRYE